MKYPLILKYTYSFIISGNYYKEEFENKIGRTIDRKIFDSNVHYIIL